MNTALHTTESEEKKTILLTFDVEDWFQVENFKNYIPFSSWSSFELRVEKNMHIILDLLDSFDFKPKATFFVLGWVAKRLPGLMREITARGHELANHGNLHYLCTQLNSKEIMEDLTSGKKMLEDTSGEKVYGYRAPSFAVNNDILKIIEDAGHLYDSSFNSFAMHGRYGIINLPSKTTEGILYQISDSFFELPVSNLSIGKYVVPLGGGGYFRLLPLLLFKLGMKWVLNKDKAFVFYSHPWEFDPDQPRVEEAPKNFKFRHYINLDKTEGKIKSMIETFKELRFLTCIDYVKSNRNL